MNARDLIEKTIQRAAAGTAERNRLPVALLSGGTWTFRQKGLTLRDVLDAPLTAAQVIAEVNREVQSDIVWPGSGYHNILVHIFGGKIKFRPQGNIDVEQPVFNDITDIDSIELDRLDQHEWITIIRSIIAEVDSAIGQEYLVGTSSWGPFTLAGQFYGVEKLMSGLYKDRQAVHALLELMSEVCYRYLAPAIEKGAAILSIAEPTASGDLISQKHFEEFVAPYLAKVIRRLKENKALITLHICGNIKDRIYLAPELGVDLLSVDYKVDLQLAQRVLDGKVALAGNVNPVLLKDGSVAEVITAAKHCLETVDLNHFILMPGCDIPPSVPLKNVQAFLEVAKHA